MKTLSCLLLAFSATVLADPADDYVNFIRQTQADTGVEWDVSVAASGASLSPEGVGDEGAAVEGIRPSARCPFGAYAIGCQHRHDVGRRVAAHGVLPVGGRIIVRRGGLRVGFQFESRFGLERRTFERRKRRGPTLLR